MTPLSPALPSSLTKPLGIGVLNARHKSTGEVFPEAIATMTTLNRDAAAAAVGTGARAATDVTGFGLLGHLHKLARASEVTAVIAAADVPYLEGAREALQEGYVSGGTRRNLDWVRPSLRSALDESELSCSPTRRPAAACWSPVRFRAPRSSASSSPGATGSSSSADRPRAQPLTAPEVRPRT